jgi:hypothetical protein
MLYHACLYDDSEMAGLGPSSYSMTEFEPSTLAFNVIRQNVDTCVAKIAKSRPLPMAVTAGGNYSQQKRAKLFNRFIEGQFDQCDVWRVGRQLARDAALFGIGIAHNFRVGSKICHERVFPWEIDVDPREAQYGAPQTLYMRRWVDRLVLAHRFPQFAGEIEVCRYSPNDETTDLGFDESADLVLVVEAWHLRSGEDADDGKHTITIANATLLSEDYERDNFPFSILRMSDPVQGFFGTGLAKLLTGLQYTINDCAARYQEDMHMSSGYILLEEGSGVEQGHLDNGPLKTLSYRNVPPQWVYPQPGHPDRWKFFTGLIPLSFQATGVSQMGATSQKPAGLNSGEAIRAYDDIESERFLLFGRAFEEYFIDVAWQFFDLAEEIAESEGSFKVRTSGRAHGRRVLFEIDYAEARLDRDTFKLFVFPTSLLSKQPSARLEQVKELAQAGWLSPEESKMLLDFPDLERVQNLEQAAHEIVEAIIERLLDGDPEDPDLYVAPEPMFNLALCAAKGQHAYLLAKLDGADEGNLALLRQFVVDAQNEMKRAQQAMAPAAPPGAMPQPPPQAA